MDHLEPSQSPKLTESSVGTNQSAVYKIGDLAREFDITLRTLRFYEDRGLIIPDRVGTTRLYSEENREDQRIVVFCKRIGLSLEDIRHVLELRQEKPNNAGNDAKLHALYAAQLQLLEQKQQDTNLAIAELKSAMSGLKSA